MKLLCRKTAKISRFFLQKSSKAFSFFRLNYLTNYLQNREESASFHRTSIFVDAFNTSAHFLASRIKGNRTTEISTFAFEFPSKCLLLISMRSFENNIHQNCVLYLIKFEERCVTSKKKR